jgi:deaminated glutathione amidase
MKFFRCIEAALSRPEHFLKATYLRRDMSHSQPRIAVGQMCSTSDVDSNFEQCRELARAAIDQKAALLSLPECFEFMGLPGSGDSIKAAQALDGELFMRYRGLAKEFGIWLSLGGFHESSTTPSKTYNTHAIVSSDGDIVASYQKLHLFDVDVDGGFKESKSTIRGESALIVRNTPGMYHGF